MAFIQNKFTSSFKNGTVPRLISVYQATGKYTEMPRAMHKHDNVLELILIADGYGVHIINGKKYYTEKGDLLILNSGIIHDESPASSLNLSIYTCALTDLQMTDLRPNCLSDSETPPLLKTKENFPYLCNLLSLMYEYTTHQEYHLEEVTNYLLRSFLVSIRGLILKRAGMPNTLEDNALAQQIKDYIDEHYPETLTLNLLASHLHISTYHASHLFKKVYGYSLMQYVMRRRIGEAQTLLIDSSESITAIAIHVGYGSSSYFHDAFTKITGMSPRKYREFYKKI